MADAIGSVAAFLGHCVRIGFIVGPVLLWYAGIALLAYGAGSYSRPAGYLVLGFALLLPRPSTRPKERIK